MEFDPTISPIPDHEFIARLVQDLGSDAHDVFQRLIDWNEGAWDQALRGLPELEDK
ncbi:hypothetical protein [Roseobacter sp.]|uniref:hypothetical protein n=1 Tax=Roseobacter sp. TaxID=1907202 RepID=UPI0029676481|nr:hypothetical protein [Roseobacter sp.]MDW3181768.1 hypothetical protein [Roseobacter sp.]